MDIALNSNNYYFKAKAVGLILKDNKILLVQMNDNGFFCVPGGHVKIDESVKDACLREIEEEVKVKVQIKQELCVIENFFESRNKKIHEITFYYIVSLLAGENLPNHDFVSQDDADGKLDFRWFNIDKLQDVDFRPRVLKEKIMAKDFKFEFVSINQLKK